MSRERLEEMDGVVDDLLNNRVELSNFVNDFYLQAERVQELESNCIHCNGKGFNGLDACDKCNRGKMLQLEQQNKRYRESLIELQGHLFNKWDKHLSSKAQWVIYEFIQGILEGDSNE